MIKQILAPQANVNDTEARIAAWHVESGVAVSVGQTLAVLETNKTAVDVEAPDSGYVYYRKEVESTIVVGELLAVIGDTMLSDAELDALFVNRAAPERQTQDPAAANQSSREVTAKAQKLMQSHGLTVADFPGSEKITVAMVDAAIAARQASAPREALPAPTVERSVPAHLVEMDYPAAKQQEVKALTASHGHVVLSEVTIAIDSVRCASRIDALSKQYEFPFTLGDLTCYGCSRLLSSYPQLNGYFHIDRPYRHRGVNIGYALNIGKGLRVPVIRDADQLDAVAIARALREFILEYAQGTLDNRRCSQGSFTITDLSSINVLAFRPVVSPMQSAILGIARDADSGQIRLILAFDHRMADGLVAGRFLNELKALMEMAADERATSAPASSHVTASNDSNHSYICVRDQVREVWQSVLGRDVEDDIGFFHAGGTSVTSVLMVEKLRQTFDREFTVTSLFRYPTITSIATYLYGGQPADAKTSTHTALPEDDSDIAIIGVGCRLPNGIDDLDSFWKVLVAQRDVITEYPESRGSWPRGGGIERGGFVIDGECFDAPFFRMSPSEAEVTDPQQRLLLETSWSCFEDACLRPAALKGTATGVFIGASNTDYAHLLQQSGAEVEAHSAVGNSLAVLANRLSYFYDFHGPSMLIDTACSASLVAMHAALQSLRAGECRLALVGGVNFICDARLSRAYLKAGMLAPDGLCKVFAESANGYVRSEGAVMLLLKRLPDAVADGNRIHAIVKGSAVNHGGQAAGLTVPNPQKQAELLISAWRSSRIDPSTISYLEAHGTGTSLGDPIEIEGMQMAFDQVLPAARQMRCAVGSVKSNIGHLESAAGLAGVLKVIAAMAQRRLPANIHIPALNSKIASLGTQLHIQTTEQAWNAPRSLIAGVSSFGSGGANAHVLVQEHVSAASPSRADTELANAFPDGNLFVLSAIDPAALHRNARAVVDWLQERPPSQHFIDALYTWQCGRTAFKHRLAFHVRDFDELERKLKAWLDAGNAAIGIAKVDQAKADQSGASQGNDALTRRDWGLLAQCWMQGHNGEWSDLYGALPSAPRFLKLPGYAFSRDRHWVPDQLQVDDAETRYLQPYWQGSDLAATVAARNIADFETHVLVWTERNVEEPLRSAMPACQVTCIHAIGDSSASRYQTFAIQCFARIKTLLSQKGARKLRIQLVAESLGDVDWVFGLHGLLKTASLEEPRLDWQIIALPANTGIDELSTLVRANQCTFESGALIKYTDTARLVRRWRPLSKTAWQNAPLRAGAYLITGGLGGLGRLFTRAILTSAPDTSVILTGRRVVDLQADEDLKSWHGARRLEYRPLQLEQREDVQAFVTDLLRDKAALRGILHCAGQVADNYIVNKSAEEFVRVLAPKLDGTLHLDEATKDIDLDFFLLFSSVMSETGNAGQADYACANGFLDQYAAWRNILVTKGERRGHSAAINWPLWQHGGMQIDASALALLKQTRGMAPMPTAVGLDCFRTNIWRGASQTLILHGDLDRLTGELNVKSSHQVASSADGSTPELAAATEEALMTLVAEQLKLPPNQRDVHAELAHYGIDSIFVNKINLALSRHFAAVSKTLFFQYRTVAAIAAHLVERHSEECRAWVSQQQSRAATPSLALATQNAVTHASRSPDRGLHAESGSTAIAIIGMSGVFPQARNLDEYWSNLAAGKDCVTEIPRTRWDLAEHYDPDVQRALAQGKSYCKHGAFVEEFAQFDPMFFGISPRDANNIDPHERLFLQEAWRAMEDAGYSSELLRQRHQRRVGVFVGVTKTEFELNGAHDPAASGPLFAHTSFSSIANRLSYFLDLSGPSMPVDTMCSSSLTAIHHACEQLRLGACEIAFVGGVNLYLHPSAYYYLCSMRMLSNDGRCRSFGEGGSGFVPGEGAAVVLLKPLDRAIADGDTVHGVVLASQVNHGGRTNGFTVPNPRAQAALVRETLDKAGVSARHVSYIEAHGTGTALGDPIELDGLQQAFSSDTSDTGFCALGSAKSNIGHLEAAAGIAGLIKVLLQMRHRQLAPTLHADTVNSNIQFESSGFALNRQLRAWRQPIVEGRELPRIAGVSSFGAGGVNAHVLLQEYQDARPGSEPSSAGGLPVVIPLSAFRTEQLIVRAQQLLGYLNAEGHECDLRRIAYSLQIGRDSMARRVAFVVDSVEALRTELDTFIAGRVGNSTCVAADAEHGDAPVRPVQKVDACFSADGQIDLQQLAALWVGGAAIDWQRLYRGQRSPRRLNLPTYPFAPEKYWPARTAVAHTASPPLQSDANVLFAAPVWRTLDTRAPQTAVFSQQVIFLCDAGIDASALVDAVNHRDSHCRCVSLSASGNNIAERYQAIALQCFEHLRELARDPSNRQTLIQCVIPNDESSHMYRGLSALLRTVSMEKPCLVGQIIAVDADVDVHTLAMRLRSLQGQPSATLVQCHRGQLQALDWQPLHSQADEGNPVYKDGGVYVITGGLGALGQLFTENIVEHCSHATVILTGRAALTETITQKLLHLQRAHSRVVYRQLDLCDAGSVTSFFTDLEAQHRKINGIMHCAGMIADSLIVNKHAADFQATLRPKVLGTYHLDQASAHLDLDFFMVFSSLASAMGSIGQSDYAAANGFMDHFIHQRRVLEQRGRRRGASVSINWPYWQEGGMRIDAATQSVLAQSVGMHPMATAIGLRAAHRAIAMNQTQLLVAQGDPQKLLVRLRGETAIQLTTRRAVTSQGSPTLDQIQRVLRQMLAEVLHASVEDIDVRKPLVELGINSVLGTEFVGAINRRFSTTLSSVSIYDHPNVHALASHLLTSQAVEHESVAATPEPIALPGPIEAPRRRDGLEEKIAVIGMSGRYPQARNLAEFWQNLAAARNAITEISSSRWDVDAYYDADPDAEGKMYSKWMGMLDDADMFDPRFFRITPQEALYMDPEQRLFLQESYRALEDAGYAGSDADGLNCGVFLGMESSEYSWQFESTPRVSETVTGNHSAIAAARLAYFLNLKGPALAVDTACSSSLVATHLACQALRSGETDLALAGGVRLWLSPVKHIGMCKARMLSPSGQCRTFDDGADGIVMGEGVGAVVLKRLSDAQRDGDHIYGVILASGINQDGKTNGITAPSVKSQIALESRLYREHAIHPESISYIEAHGTGTRLGDPIELQALATVFAEQTQLKQFCALGSVKTNIGHTAPASGVASLHKVLLCLKHRHLVPTLNVETENRHFDLKNSPFYLNREYKPWRPAPGHKRRACISSFGFSGTNAHMVIEEYEAPSQAIGSEETHEAVLIPLSARNAAQLKQRAHDLLQVVEQDAAVASRLMSLAYTLQIGRAPMEERAAFVVRSLDELKAGLRTLAEDSADTVGVQRGRLVDDDETVSLWNSDEDLQLTLDRWLRERKLAKLLGLWIKGVELDWRKLYRGLRPARMSLPTYPFAEERFWIDRRSQNVPESVTQRQSVSGDMHPLVHRNVSDLNRQAYRSRFKGNEFFLNDHRVNGARVLPGVAYLEMVRAALALALPDVTLQDFEFQDHAWLQPVIVDREVEITVVLFDNLDAATAERRIDYEISSDGNAGSTLHCRGSVRWGSALPTIDAIDVGTLNDALQHKPIEAAALYRRFAELGLRYGPSMQGIVRLATNGEEVQAQLRLPNGPDPLARDFGLHPSMLDAAMQSTICLVAGFGSNSNGVALPFSFDTMRVCTATSRDMLAWARLSTASGSLKKFDIDLVDESGAPCVQIRGLVARAIAEPAVPTTLSIGKKRAPKPELRMLLPVWNAVSFEHGAVTPPVGEKCLLLGGDERLYQWLREALGDLEHWQVPADASIASIKHRLSSAQFDHLLWFAPDGAAESIVDGQNRGVISLFRIIKALTQLDDLDRELKLTVVTFKTQQVFDTDTIVPDHAGVHGLMGSVAKEMPLWRIRLLDIESIENVTAREMPALPWDEQGRGLVHRHDAWFRQEFADMNRIPATQPGYERNGVYVVIGGAGGLGEVWTRHLVRHFDADVIWIGRRPLDERIEAKLDAIAAFGKRPRYFAADASDETALAAAVAEIGKHFPRINGVVHSALVLQDRSVRGMDETVFRESLVAKVDMSVNLEQVFRDHALDFMLFFSSMSSFTRGAGQSNYCAGCTFKDSFAHSVRAVRRYPVKVVNWGYWGSVGVVADEFHRKRMEKLGLGSIEPEEAMQVLQQFVASDLNQIVFVKVLSDAALDELLVSEEIRYYTDLDMSNESLG